MYSLLNNGPKVPMKILWDIAASQSFVLEGVYPFSNVSDFGFDILMLGFGMNDMGVPLHKISVESDLVSGKVAVGVRP